MTLVIILHAAVAGDVLIGRQCGRAGHVGLDPGGRGHALDDLLDGLDRLVGQRFALVAGEVDLDVGGLAVVALCTGRGQRVAPEVLDVFDVFGVGVELFDDLVVVACARRAERIFAFQHDHHRAVGLVLVEYRAHVLRRDHRLRIVGAHRHRAHLPDIVKLRHNGVEHRDDRDPAQDDRYRRTCG